MIAGQIFGKLLPLTAMVVPSRQGANARAEKFHDISGSRLSRAQLGGENLRRCGREIAIEHGALHDVLFGNVSA
jgi:hypothetical protein